MNFRRSNLASTCPSKNFAAVSNAGLSAAHEKAADRRYPATNTPAADPYEAPPVPQRNGPGRYAREAPLPTLGLPHDFWVPPASQTPYVPKPRLVDVSDRWKELMALGGSAPSYVHKQPRIRIVSEGVPGVGRRR
jgi:hypothetical protein